MNKGTMNLKRKISAMWLITGLVAVLGLVVAACGDAEEDSITTQATARSHHYPGTCYDGSSC